MSNRQSLSVLRELRRQILSGNIDAGQKLRASHLSQVMEASRTPISEALLKLSEEGLLIRDKSGFTVRTFQSDEVFDAIALRGFLEAAAVQRAAERRVSAAELKPAHELLLEMDDVIARGEPQHYDHLNEAFHITLIHLSQSRILIEETLRAYRYPFAGPSAFPVEIRDTQRFHASLSFGQMQHHQIFDALKAGESMRVFALMSEHARLAFPNIKDAIRAKEKPPQLALVEK